MFEVYSDTETLKRGKFSRLLDRVGGINAGGGLDCRVEIEFICLGVNSSFLFAGGPISSAGPIDWDF